MIESLKEIILDYQELIKSVGMLRRLGVQPVKGKATICIGIRRSGKSTYMLQLMQELIDQGVSRHNILYLNFFDDRLHYFQHDKLGLILEAYFSLYPEKKNTQTIYCFFDEIQMINDWESFVERIMRSEKCEVYITGSSAKMLSKEIATQMRGRALSWEIFPFSFKEFLTYMNIEYKSALSTKQRLIIQKGFGSYWLKGAFPEVLLLENHLRIKIHQEYFHTILFRDLIERHNISHPKAITDLAYWLIDNTSAMYSINSLTGYLRSLGHKISKTIVAEYLSWCEDAYFFFTVRIFDASLARSHANPKKIYCIDHGLVTSVSSGILVNSGHLLENLVFISLRRIASKIFYYKTKSGKEVDFIVHLPNKKFVLIQVCESLANMTTKKREVAALDDAMTELKLSSSMIVTRNEEEDLRISDKMISVIPIWKFLLELENI